MSLVPYQPRTLLVRPFLADGFTPGGLLISLDRRYPPVLGRVLAAGRDCLPVVPGDTVVFRPHACEEAESNSGTIYVIALDACAGRIIDYTEGDD
jgi:hypothetical protein